jgi:hypothetical protein
MSMKFGAVRVAMVGLLATAGLAGCEGASANMPHKDAGSEGSAGYGAGSSGGFGSQGGGSSGGAGGDDATAAASDDASGSAADSGAPGEGGDEPGEAGAGTAHTEGGAPASTCQVPEGGAPCDPGRVACGSTSCETSNQYCCVGGGSGGSGDVCSAFNGASCPSSALTVACDETADCVDSVCCEENVGAGMQGPSQCMSSCPGGWFKICKSDRECGEGDGGGSLNRCIVQTCTQIGLLGGGTSVTIEACAVPATLGNLGNRGALPGCVAQ